MGLLARYLGRSPFDDRWYTPGAVVPMNDASSLGTEGALKVATVYRAVNVAAAAVAVLPIEVQKRKGRRGWQPAEGDSFRTKLRLQPNVMQTSFRWRHHLVGHLMLSGNYYSHKHGWGTDDAQLRPLDGSRMRVPEIGADGTLRYVYTKRSGEPVHLTQDEVFHARGFSLDGVCGVSVLDLMREHVTQAAMNRQQRTAFVRNGLRPSVVIKHTKELTAKAETNILQGFAKAFGGPNRAGRPLVLGEGADIVPFQITGKDAQWVESEHFLLEEFLRFTGIPGVLVGYADKTATYASAEAFFQSFVTHCIWPITGNLEQELTTSLYGVQEDLRVRFNLDALMRADSAARAAFYRALVELGIFTRNEVRELEGKNPLKGLDEPLTPKNMGGASPDAAPAAPTPLMQPRPPAPVPPEEDEARAARLANGEEIARRAAARIVRKEAVALLGTEGRLGAAARFARDAAGWRAWVTDFYARHVDVVAETLGLSLAAAQRYCDGHRDEVLVSLEHVGQWEATAVPRLVELALGHKPSAPSWTVVVNNLPGPGAAATVVNNIPVPAVINRVEVPPATPPPVYVQNTVKAAEGPQDVRIVEMPKPARVVKTVEAWTPEGRIKRVTERAE